VDGATLSEFVAFDNYKGHPDQKPFSGKFHGALIIGFWNIVQDDPRAIRRGLHSPVLFQQDAIHYRTLRGPMVIPGSSSS